MEASASEPFWKRRATDVVEALRSGRVTPLELVREARERVLAVDGVLNAVPTQCFARAEARARLLSERGFPRDPERGYLYGLPILVKDTLAVKDVRFTKGSLIWEHNVATRDDPVVEILERKGGIVIGKTNTPELGLGSNTYNFVFGETVNPWDTRLTSGGSSGGSACALASGQGWLALGTDLGGSLRIPASFCHVVGLRPTPRRVPMVESASTSEPRLHSVVGPMARNVPDLALLMDAIYDRHRDDPHCAGPPSESFADVLRTQWRERLPRRAAWSPTLGGAVPIEPEVVRACEDAARWFARSTEARVDFGAACMDLSRARETFRVLRAEMFRSKGWLLRYGDKVKPEVVWQVRQGLDLAEGELARARRDHAALLRDTAAFFDRHDLLLCPCTMTAAFDVGVRWLKSCEGWDFGNYVDWLMPTSILSLTNCPSLSIPCGFTETSGLPVGLQMVAAPGREADLLCAALAFERAHPYSDQVPIDPRIAVKL